MPTFPSWCDKIILIAKRWEYSAGFQREPPRNSDNPNFDNTDSESFIKLLTQGIWAMVRYHAMLKGPLTKTLTSD